MRPPKLSDEEKRAYALKLHQNPMSFLLRDDLVWDNFYPAGNEALLNDLRFNLLSPQYPGIALQGTPGSGKTHLLQGAVHAARASGQSAVYLPLETFRSHGPDAISGFYTFDWLMLDDIDLIAGDEPWETALFAVLNHAWSRKCHLIYAVTGSLGNVEWRLPDLASRLGWGLVCTLHDLDDTQKIGWLNFWAQRRGVEIPEPVAHWLITRYSRDNRELYKLLVKLDEVSLQAQRRLTVPFVKSVIDLMGD